MAAFIHHDLRLLNPLFSSPLPDVITELEHLRRLNIRVDAPPKVFQQLKDVFHYLESLGSARIEGNHTTLADYIDAKLTPAPTPSDALQELQNIEAAMQQVETAVPPGEAITDALIRGLHATTVSDLKREGDRTPGAYRLGSVEIGQADHRPPEAVKVPGYMTELVDFINQVDPPKYDLMKVALAHHRFAWIHPFSNGNGRVVRLLTYAMLLKYGFRVNDFGRVLNPTAVFCSDRARYYAMLARADTGTDDGLEAWCVYVLTGIRDELRKVDQLASYDYLKSRILIPALAHARERQLVTPHEDVILATAIRAGTVKHGDIASALPKLKNTQLTYQIKKLVDGGMLQQVEPKARRYTIGFSNNGLLRGVIRALETEGFIPAALAGENPGP
ncbi:MAG: Fic family protein [Gammaproteobacteria bacterium]|nr:Fic family protein [Gammaproteobacteria bacterium]